MIAELSKTFLPRSSLKVDALGSSCLSHSRVVARWEGSHPLEVVSLDFSQPWGLPLAFTEQWEGISPAQHSMVPGWLVGR